MTGYASRGLWRVLLLAPLAAGCAKGSPAVQTPPDEQASAPSAQTASGQAPSAGTQPRADVLPALLQNVPAAAADCPKAGPLPETSEDCPDALSRLATALSSTDDAALAGLEGCKQFTRGAIRTLRAERAPRCADQLVEPVVGLSASPVGLDAEIQRTLTALGLGARLARTVQAPPAAPASGSKAELQAYFTEQLFPWATAQAGAIHQMALQGAKLSGYARGVVAIEAAMADMRFVEMARAVPLPDELKADDVQTEYYAALDEALEPRKSRGRDAALVALGEFAGQGIIQSERLTVARKLIASVYAGNRIAALDQLLVPPAAACAATTDAERVARAVETPLAGWLFAAQAPRSGLTQCLLSRGLPLFLARQLEAAGDQPSAAWLGRAYFDLGRTYFQAGAFQKAEALLRKAGDAPLLVGISQALRSGPTSAADLFRLGPRLPESMGNVVELLALASQKQPDSGAAAFDAAYLRELSAPSGSPEFWKDLSVRYAAAAAGLTGADKQRAKERGAAASATARALAAQLR